MERKDKLVNWIDSRLPVFTFFRDLLRDYQTPKNLNYFWNFGSILGVLLVVMIVTGLVLAMQYTPHVDMAFESVERIMRDVNYGWLLRYIHSNGASFFFIVVYSRLRGKLLTELFVRLLLLTEKNSNPS